MSATNAATTNPTLSLSLSSTTTTETTLMLAVSGDDDSPLRGGGQLRYGLSGTLAQASFGSGGATLTTTSVVDPTGASSYDLRVELPSSEVLRITLTAIGVDADRVSFDVDYRSATPSVQPLPGDPSAYTWRLSGKGEESGSTTRFDFELVQEKVPTMPLDPQASVRLDFAQDSNETHKELIKVKVTPVEL